VRLQASLADLQHACQYGRGVGVRERVDEILDRTASRWGPVVAPASANRTALAGLAAMMDKRIEERALTPRYTIGEAALLVGRRADSVSRWSFGHERN